MASNILRITIAKEWRASEFGELLFQLQFLADVAGFSDVKIDGQSPVYFPFQRRRALYGRLYDAEDELRGDVYLRRVQAEDVLRFYGPHISELKIQRLEFASPGFADLAGLGKVVEQLRIFVTDIFDRHLHKEERAIARKSAAQDLLAKKINNAEALLKLGDKMGLDAETKRLLVSEVLLADYYLEGKVLTGQLKSIS